jgi:hypothetical protein
MADTAQQNTRLPRRFHNTFKPERQYIHAMLRFAAAQKSGTYQEIRDETGIPMGKSSGKVSAILDYSRGMGLIHLAGDVRSAVKRPELTPFGRVVLFEDPHLKEAITQWIAHFNLCGPLIGADVWYYVFFQGSQRLGVRFSREKLDEYLRLTYKKEDTNLIGPLVGMYEDSAAFSLCGALSEIEGVISQEPAPIIEELGFAYGAWVLQQMSNHFPPNTQITVTELDAKAGWRSIPGWDATSVKRVLELMERKGILDVDRHMNPWILRPMVPVDDIWQRIYDDLI